MPRFTYGRPIAERRRVILKNAIVVFLFACKASVVREVEEELAGCIVYYS